MIPTNVRPPNYWDKGIDGTLRSWRGVHLECMDINDDVMGINLPANTPRWVKKSE